MCDTVFFMNMLPNVKTPSFVSNHPLVPKLNKLWSISRIALVQFPMMNHHGDQTNRPLIHSYHQPTSTLLGKQSLDSPPYTIHVSNTNLDYHLPPWGLCIGQNPIPLLNISKLWLHLPQSTLQSLLLSLTPRLRSTICPSHMHIFTTIYPKGMDGNF